MKCFDPTAVPVLSRLANEFAVCDAWFSSVPGPTWPNRLFVHAATSNGYVDNSVHVYNSRTIFENLAASGRTWAVYLPRYGSKHVVQRSFDGRSKESLF